VKAPTNNTTKQNTSIFERGNAKSSEEVDFSKWKLVLIVVVLIIIFHFVSADLCSQCNNYLVRR